MRLVRYSETDSHDIKAGILQNGDVLEASETLFGDESSAFESILETITESGPGSIRSKLDEFDRIGRDGVRIHPPIPKDRRLFCLGGVYTGHLREAGLELTVDPNQWVMPENAIIGPEEDIILPDRVAENVKPAAELCVVIGRPGKYIGPMESYDYIAGYSVSNDVTARTDWPGPMAYKMMDTFSPIGPHVTTADEVERPMNLDIVMRQDGDVICRGSTAGMRFSLSFLVSYLSTLTKLHPGDVISCGDPGGVQAPLKPGSTVEIDIENVGTLRNDVRTEQSPD